MIMEDLNDINDALTSAGMAPVRRGDIVRERRETSRRASHGGRVQQLLDRDFDHGVSAVIKP